ncbi:MAG: hypothetical protein P8188_09050 [Gemmatimonadota bacterium]
MSQAPPPSEATLEASARGDAGTLRSVLAQGASTETTGEDDSTLLIHAAGGARRLRRGPASGRRALNRAGAPR